MTLATLAFAPQCVQILAIFESLTSINLNCTVSATGSLIRPNRSKSLVVIRFNDIHRRRVLQFS